MRESDLERAARLLGEVFAHDPVFTALLGGEASARIEPAVALYRLAQPKLMPRQFHDPPHPALFQEARVEIAKPPGGLPGGLFEFPKVVQAYWPTAEATALAEPSVPVSAEIALSHWVNGASVT